MFELHNTQWSALEMYARRDEIDLAPPYQRRGGLWSRRDQAFLIDSMLNGFDIPKIYLSDVAGFPTHLRDNVHRFAVIDGRQRLEAIYAFLGDDLPLNRDLALLDDPEVSIAGWSFRMLLSEMPWLSDRIVRFPLSVVVVSTDDEARVRQMFVRLNRNKSLSGAEARNAMEGFVPPLIRRIAQHQFFQHWIGFSTARGGDLNLAAKLLLIEFRGQLVDTKKGPLDKFVREAVQAQSDLISDALDAESPESDFVAATERVEMTLNRMTEVFGTRDPLLRNQGPITIFYWFIRELGDGVEPVAVRSFISEFETQRRLQRRMLRDGRAEFPVDQELVEYELMNRSTNDQISLEGRFSILIRRFERFPTQMPV
jgi:hypothetical protein